METRTLQDIAREIRSDWKSPYFGAVPYLDALSSLGSVKDQYGYDSGRDMVIYFLSNATTWRGETARKVKAELKALLK